MATSTFHPTSVGYMTEKIRGDYISHAIKEGLLPDQAHRMPQVLSLEAPNDTSKPIQFWQLHSVLGQERIVQIVIGFYKRVYEQEDWFRSVFERVGDLRHHVNTQASMWVDTMGGGHYYHGAEFRLSFHHQHNAFQLMNRKGAELWTKLMVETLDNAGELLTDDPRVRPAINTFLSYFMGKYAAEFSFDGDLSFGETNPPQVRRIDFMRMSEEAISALPEDELRAALADRGVDVAAYPEKRDLVEKALML